MADVTLFVELANGTTLRAQGTIDAESWESQDNKLSVSLLPHDNTWSVFSGSGDVSGTIRKVTIAGVTYRALGDTNINLVPQAYKNEMVPTSGGNMLKKTKQVRTVTGVTLACNATEVEALRVIAEAA
jgi:hypothetical protein